MNSIKTLKNILFIFPVLILFYSSHPIFQWLYLKLVGGNFIKLIINTMDKIEYNTILKYVDV